MRLFSSFYLGHRRHKVIGIGIAIGIAICVFLLLTFKALTFLWLQKSGKMLLTFNTN